jgi:ATP:ADP antiporter, AAA family
MRSAPLLPESAVLIALVCAGIVTAQVVAGKATRDALYLAHLSVSTLPAIVSASAVASMLFALLSSVTLRRVHPATFVPALFASNALLLLAGWGCYSFAPTTAAVALYLQFSAFGPLLGSGFWLVTTERFDPRTAKQRFGQITGAGTVGGLLGGAVAERVAAVLPVHAMLPMLAAISFAGAWQVRRLALSGTRAGNSAIEAASTPFAAPARSGLQVLSTAPHLRNLAGVVFVGAIGATLVDYLFKVDAVAALGPTHGLLRFFAIYYAATSVVTFLVQTSLSRQILERFGLGVGAASPSAALIACGLGALLVPGFKGITAVRAGEAVFRDSLFRAAYELFYTPFLPADKRAAKSLIDVGADRLGDAVAGGLIALLLIIGPSPHTVILGAAMVSSAGTLLLTRQLRRGYVYTLERCLLTRAVELDATDVGDRTTRTVFLRALSDLQSTGAPLSSAAGGSLTTSDGHAAGPGGTGAELSQIITLRSRDSDRVIAVLRSEERLPDAVATHVIPLLAWDPVAQDAVVALQRVADEHIGQLTDVLLDPTQPFAVRRRVPRVLSACTVQRAVDGLLLGLDDSRFEVRFECARALAAILEKNPNAGLDREHILRVVRREVGVNRGVWESQQVLDRLDDRAQTSFVDEFVKSRASRSLAHVFTLLSLVLPAEPLHIAYRGLHTDDRILRGTALEYLDATLPPDIRERLWAFLEDGRPTPKSGRPREEILADLMRSDRSIRLNLEELRRRTGRTG